MMLQQIKYAIEDIRERKLFLPPIFYKYSSAFWQSVFSSLPAYSFFHFGKSCFISKIWMKFTL